MKTLLPVDAILADVVESLRRNPNLVIEAAPGAGKTTRVPPAVMGLVAGEVVVLEPRRIAARMAARRVAAELGDEVGGVVGYQVRFEDKTGPGTRLRFVTEGVLTRRLLRDPELRGVDAVVLDEFHERHLDGDLALALLKRLQRRRPELRLVVMSATLDAGPVAAYLGGCPVLRCAGRMFPLTVRHLPHSNASLQAQVRGAVEMLLAEGQTGNVLAFLPGAAEIRRAMRECDAVARRAGMVVLPLHGELTPAEQDRAVLPNGERKLILATNVAESSVTVEGVTAVIDSGLARRATYSPWTGLPTLQVGRVSKASATQRAGRAGRTGAGQVVRLYPEEDFMQRPQHDLPEIRRADLAQLLLSLRAMKMDRLDDLEWLDAPPREAVEIAEGLLDRIGATGEMVGRLARFPLHPRLARVVVAAMERGVGQDGCRVAAMLSLGVRSEKNELLAVMDGAVDAPLREHTGQLLRLAGAQGAARSGQARHDDDELLLAVLAGFPDRVARRRGGNQLWLATGVAAELAGPVAADEFVMAIDAEDRAENPQPLVRLVGRVEPEWLLELFPERIEDRVSVEWNGTSERVERVRSLLYDRLVLEETRGNASNEEAAALLALKVLEAGVEGFVDAPALELFLARNTFAELSAPDVAGCVRELCAGLHSFADFREAAKYFVGVLEQRGDAERGDAQRGEARRLAELAPATVKLAGGRQTKVHYEVGRPPWIASRLQDFFGMQETPRIGPARTALVVHLLAPNQRAVQTTTDLAGFWERLYPSVRRELMRRYPRHLWPEMPGRK